MLLQVYCITLCCKSTSGITPCCKHVANRFGAYIYKPVSKLAVSLLYHNLLQVYSITNSYKSNEYINNLLQVSDNDLQQVCLITSYCKFTVSQVAESLMYVLQAAATLQHNNLLHNKLLQFY